MSKFYNSQPEGDEQKNNSRITDAARPHRYLRYKLFDRMLRTDKSIRKGTKITKPTQLIAFIKEQSILEV